MSFDYDLFVIGAGSGGVRAARMSAGMARGGGGEEFGWRHMRYSWLRAKKAVCLCQPLCRIVREAAGFGWRVGAPEFDWPTLLANKDAELTVSTAFT